MKIEEIKRESMRIRVAKSKVTDEDEHRKLSLQANALKAVSTAISNLEVAGKERRELNENEIEGVIRKQVKNRRESAKIYSEAGEVERTESETIEADYLESLLPRQLGEDEVEAIIDEIISRNQLAGAGGKGMGVVMKELKGRSDVDPTIASTLAKKKLI